MSLRGSSRKVTAPLPASPRKPSERVVDYLLAEFDRPDRASGSRLPTVRQLADHLHVSIPTVHGVIQRLAKEGRLRTIKGSGTFLVQKESARLDRLTFAVDMPGMGSALDNPWHHQIFGGMLAAALRAPVPVSFLPAASDSMLDEDVAKNLMAQRSKADGLILFPFNRLAELFAEVRSAYERDGKPVVTMHPASDLVTMDFVSPHYFDSCFQMASAWRKTGRRRVALLLVQPFEVSTSARLRWSGLANGLGTALGREVSLHAIASSGPASDPGEERAYLGVKGALAEGMRLDAIFAAADPAALGALRAVQEAGLRVPEDVSVVGNTGLDLSDTACPGLTRTRYPLPTIGRKLLEMLLQRIERRSNGDDHVAGVYVAGPFVGGATTRPVENEALGIRSGPSR
jgi:DNA-binding LacI/PurR family transcriptional regulator